MKTQKLISAITVFTVIIIQTIFAQNTLELYNNTADEIYFSYVKYDYEYKSWTSRGWYKINGYSTESLDLGNYKGKVYIHGQFTGWITNKYWGNGYSFCVEPTDAFNIRFSDKIGCEFKRNFSETNISYGKNNYTFNP